MKAKTNQLWAPIIKAAKGRDWIDWGHVRATKRDSEHSFFANVMPEYEQQLRERVRFAKVTITEQ